MTSLVSELRHNFSYTSNLIEYGLFCQNSNLTKLLNFKKYPEVDRKIARQQNWSKTWTMIDVFKVRGRP